MQKPYRFLVDRVASYAEEGKRVPAQAEDPQQAVRTCLALEGEPLSRSSSTARRGCGSRGPPRR